MRSYLLTIVALITATASLFSQEEERKPVGQRSLSRTEIVAIEEERYIHASENSREEGIEEEEVFGELPKESFDMLQVSAAFYTSHPGALHTVTSISPLGGTLAMEDGSYWSIKGDDMRIVLNWMPGDVVVISPNRSFFTLYDYCITNQSTEEVVRVNLLLRPIYNSMYTHWIVAIDDFYGLVYLEDGSAWNISTFDSGIIGKWYVNDTIIIGINDGWLSNSRPNVLINVETMTYAKANCVY